MVVTRNRAKRGLGASAKATASQESEQSVIRRSRRVAARATKAPPGRDVATEGAKKEKRTARTKKQKRQVRATTSKPQRKRTQPRKSKRLNSINQGKNRDSKSLSPSPKKNDTEYGSDADSGSDSCNTASLSDVDADSIGAFVHVAPPPPFFFFAPRRNCSSTLSLSWCAPASPTPLLQMSTCASRTPFVKSPRSMQPYVAQPPWLVCWWARYQDQPARRAACVVSAGMASQCVFPLPWHASACWLALALLALVWSLCALFGRCPAGPS